MKIWRHALCLQTSILVSAVRQCGHVRRILVTVHNTTYYIYTRRGAFSLACSSKRKEIRIQGRERKVREEKNGRRGTSDWCPQRGGVGGTSQEGTRVQEIGHYPLNLLLHFVLPFTVLICISIGALGFPHLEILLSFVASMSDFVLSMSTLDSFVAYIFVNFVSGRCGCVRC